MNSVFTITQRSNDRQVIPRRLVIVILAVFVGYIASGCADIFDIYFPACDLYSYNKYISISLAGVLVLQLFMRQKTEFVMPAGKWIIVFFAYVLLHSFYPGGDHWFTVAFPILKVYIFFLLIINLFRTKEEYRILGKSFILIVIATLTVYFVELKEITPVIYQRFVAESAGFYINANTVSYLAVLAFIIFSSLYVKQSRRRILLFSCLLASTSFIVISNGSRAAFLLLIISAIIFMLKFKKAKYLIPTFVLLLTIYYIISPYLGNINLFISRIEGLKFFTEEQRWNLTTIAWSKFLDAPLWGEGYDSLFQAHTVSINHLWYLNILVAYGAIGLFLLLISFFKIISIREMLSSKSSIILSLFIVSYLFLAPPVMFISIALAFLYYYGKQKVNASDGPGEKRYVPNFIKKSG